MNILTSYNIHNNDKLRNAVTRMEMYINKELKWSFLGLYNI